ncbi:MAG: hypothetical protein ACAH59_09805 [Pseudobdellovibrionaceae bacterium]
MAPFLALIFTLAVTGSSFAKDKLSLEKMTSGIQKSDEIAALYKLTADLQKDPAKELKPLLQANQKPLAQLQKEFLESANFIRGEIESEKVLNQLMACLQLSMLKSRAHSFQSEWPQMQNEFSSWFLFAADFPYEESSLVGLRTSGVIRSLLLDELEKIQTRFAAQLASQPTFRQWFLKVRAPWPVDRVLISEAKRLLKPPMMSVANAAARAFQKNPYQTSQQALEKIKGGQSEGAELLKQIWREADIQLMKTEINRIGKLKLRLAKAEFENVNKKAPDSVQTLLNAGLLDQAPVDYFTGKALDLTSL